MIISKHTKAKYSFIYLSLYKSGCIRALERDRGLIKAIKEKKLSIQKDSYW